MQPGKKRMPSRPDGAQNNPDDPDQVNSEHDFRKSLQVP